MSLNSLVLKEFNPMPTLPHFLSIDLEDWHTSAFLRNHLPKGKPVSQIEESTMPILSLLKETKTFATFFVLGSIAQEHPNLIKQIVEDGHEIASHGFSHTPLWQLTPASFKSELELTNKLLEEISGRKVKGFRAPYCSLDQSTAWTLPILQELGFEYDSSIFPMRTSLYGVKDAPTGIYRISGENILQHQANASLIEIPFTVASYKIARIPCTGGIYGRILPFFILDFLLKQVSANRPINFYFHPWEVYPNTIRIKAPLFNRFVSYYQNDVYLARIRKLLDTYHFSSFEKILPTLAPTI
jgi:polysaccharide deacetylase family protein (PEP-CTERM system associated)